MRRISTVRYRLVDTIPERIDDGVLYVSREYATAVHRCCCGCGHEVVTPLGPTDWNVTIDGDAVSVYPSIGNWSFPCQSHYWIRRNRIEWSYKMSPEEIEDGRRYEARAKELYFGVKDQDAVDGDVEESVQGHEQTSRESLMARLRRWLFG